jgi:tetratricopeptide (TPR) repeat protein
VPSTGHKRPGRGQVSDDSDDFLGTAVATVFYGRMDSETDPGAGLAKHLKALHQAAGRPTYDRVVNAVHQHRGKKTLSDSTLSGWFRGKSVPSDTALFRAVVEYLLASAPDFPHQSLVTWEQLRAAAEAQRNKRRGRRPRPEAPAKLLLFALPRPPAQPFTGRKIELGALERAGRQPGRPQITVIHGLSGAGKTELAVQYAGRNRARHSVIWWTAASTTEAIAAGLARMGRRLPGQHSGVAEAELTESAIRWLQEHDHWLLILDDVSSRGAVEEFLGGLGSGHILITSRRDLSWGGIAHRAVHLQSLDPEASHDLLTAHCSAADADRLNELADDMGHLPLALCQAAAYIQQSKTSVGTYLARLRSQPVRALTTTAYGDPSDQAVGRVLAITVEAVEQQSPFAIVILGVLACYAPHDVPRELLQHPDEFLVDDALAALASFNLITLTTDTVSVHRLVQIFANEHLRKKTRTSDSADLADQVPRPHDDALELAYMLLSAYRPTGNPQTDVDDWPRWSALAPHVDALLAHVPVEEAGDGLGALAGEMALFHHGQGNPARALELSRHSLQITESNFGPNAVEVAIQLDNIAGALRDLGRYAEVEDLQRRAVEICEADPDRSHLAIRLDNLAHTLHMKGRLEEAEQMHRRALSIVEETLGADDPEYAASLNSLAMTLTAQGRSDESEPILRQALVINETHFGSTNPRVADNLDNLGTALQRLRRAKEAEPAHRRALLITEQLLGENHPAVAVRLANLASAMRELGNLDESLSMQQRALNIHLESGGPEHPEVAISLVNLAAILTDAGAYLEAERHLRRALEIHFQILDANHPQISVTKTNLVLQQEIRFRVGSVKKTV